MPHRERLDLQAERLRTEKQWHETPDQYVPLSLAAATTFHQSHPATATAITRGEYENALHIAAVALSKLLSIYTLNARQETVELRIDLGMHRFALGATQVRGMNGDVIEPLLVKHSDVIAAIPVIRQIGLPYSFASPPS